MCYLWRITHGSKLHKLQLQKDLQEKTTLMQLEIQIVELSNGKWVEKYPKRCITYYANLPGDPEVDGDGHGTDIEGAMCFIRQGQRWTLGVAGEWEVDGGMETDVKPAVDKATKKAVAAWGS